MKLFIKRNTSLDKSCFTVYDELGNEKYKASFTGSKSVSKLIVSDSSDKAVLKIRKIPIVGTHTFAFKAGKHHITFVMIISSNRILGYYYGNNWHINGEIAKGNFSIIDVDNSVIATLKKHTDYIELNITDDSDELYCVATSICTNLINTVDKLAIQAV